MPDIPLSTQQLKIPNRQRQRSFDVSEGVNKAIDSIGGLLGVETPEQKQAAVKNQLKLNALAVKNQHDSALIKATEEQLLFTEEVTNNPGDFTADDIDKRIQEINSSASNNIQDVEARESFNQSIQIPSVKTGINLRAQKNQYEIAQADVNTTKALKMLESGPAGIVSMNRIVDSQVEAGVYTYDQGELLKRRTKAGMVLSDAEVSPELTLDRLKDQKTDYYGIDDSAHRDSLISQVMSIESQNKRINALKEAKAHTVAYNEELQLLDSPDVPYVDKVDSIDRKIKTGAVSEKIGKVLNKALLSKYWGDSETELSTFSDLILTVARLAEGKDVVKDLKTSKVYLDNANLVKNMIVSARADNKLTKDHYEKLIDDLNNKVVQKEGEALEKVSKEDKFGWSFDPSHANEKFVANFEDNPFIQQDLLKSYYLATEGKEGLDNEKKEIIADSLVNEQKNKTREIAFNIMRELPPPQKILKESEIDLLKRFGKTEEDISNFLAKNKGKTRADLINYLRSRGVK